MKIKKKKKKGVKKTILHKQSDRTNFFIVAGVIALVNILIYFTAFPSIDSITAAGPDSGSAQGSFFVKAASMIAADIFLFVTLSMILSRMSAKRKKR